MIKKMLIAIAGIIVLPGAVIIVLTMVAPSDVKVERSITVNKPKAEVFAYLKNLKNQSTWGPWAKKDPAMKQEYRRTDGTVGFVSSWSGNSEVGEGEQEIKKITEGERIDTELRFKKPFEVTNNAYIITESAGDNATNVKWGFTGSLPRPMNIMLLVMDMDKEVGKDFAEGLSNLKTLLEK